MYNFVLSSTPDADVYSDSFSVYHMSTGAVLATSESPITALCGTSKNFIFGTQSKQLVRNGVPEPIFKQLAVFNLTPELPFCLRNGDIVLNQNIIYNRSVSVTACNGTSFGDRDGIVFTLENGKITHFRNHENAVISLQKDVVITTRSVFLGAKKVFSAARIDGGLAFNGKIYVLVGEKIVIFKEEIEIEIDFPCLPRISKSVPQLQIKSFQGEVLVFSNDGIVYGLDGQERMKLAGKECTAEQAKAAWVVTELYANELGVYDEGEI
ncbi:hypothetical protein SS50377_27859 [Spironucleus salmonicida]|uniref:Uncharacterized protein n=1 Tax=Spironucleus salmonicida TaxID=348837 RepID=V6M626_9EUKA|nr:hypothetical protein SS50377_27859 [Spironucleus salmonicida]|eukprot:EST48824.1 Hypothetical protein SS50377_10920 [Spironucleus salmonicida]